MSYDLFRHYSVQCRFHICRIESHPIPLSSFCHTNTYTRENRSKFLLQPLIHFTSIFSHRMELKLLCTSYECIGCASLSSNLSIIIIRAIISRLQAQTHTHTRTHSHAQAWPIQCAGEMGALDEDA